MEKHRQGVEECRKLRNNSKIVIRVANEVKNEDWEDVAKQLGSGRQSAKCLQFCRHHFDCGIGDGVKKRISSF